MRLLPKLDVDADGQVLQREFEAGPYTLQKYDLDNDQTLSVTELVPFRDPLNCETAVVAETAVLPFVCIAPGWSVAAASARLLERYGDGRAIPIALP